MGAYIMFSVCIYDSYDENNLIVNHIRDDVSFQTDIAGGFTSSKFSIPYNNGISINYWIDKHVVIFDIYGDRVYEGSINKPIISGDTISITTEGYFAKGDRISAGPMYFSGQLEGALVSVAVDTAGTGYEVDDILTATTGGNGGSVRVDKVNDQGEVEEILINTYGYGYAVGTSAVTGGSGSGFVLDITTVETGSTAYNIARFMADLNPYWQDDYSRIEKLDRLPIGPFTFTRKDKISGALKESKKFGYLDTENYTTDKRRAFFYVIYDNRILELKRVPDITIDEPDWEISIHNIIGNQPLKMNIDASKIINQIWVEYNDPDLSGNTFTLGTKDRDSIEKYGLRQGVVSIGQGTSDIADVVEELIMEHKTNPIYSSTINVIGTVYTRYGVPTPIWKVRAGDLIRIMDFDVGLEGMSGDKLASTSFVAKTNYNHKSRTMNITLGSGERLDILLKRLGV